jgi:hypothetical protein
MRVYAGILPRFALAATLLGAASSCDNVTAGRPADPSGGPKLVHLLIQDYSFIGGPPGERAAAVDLLDHAAPPACSDINPCVNQFLIAQNTPPLDCSNPKGGMCIDPLAVPSTGVPLNAGSNAIRIVFNKLLNASEVETVMTDANGKPVSAASYMLKSGLVELLNADGTPAGMSGFYDDSGPSDFTSDLILVPFGPAIVIKPSLLAPKSTYTVRIHSSRLHDKLGEQITDANGTTLPDPADFNFTTEDVTLNADGTHPDFRKTTPIAPNEIVQVFLWEPLDETTLKITITGPAGFDPTTVEGYADRGGKASAKACAAALTPTLINFVATNEAPPGDAMRKPVDWAAGNYTFSFTAKDRTGTSTYTSPTWTFSVAGADADPAKDGNAFAQHVIPEQCQ